MTYFAFADSAMTSSEAVTTPLLPKLHPFGPAPTEAGPPSDGDSTSDPPEGELSYPLEQQADESLVYRQSRFSARIAPDGQVEFNDVRVHLEQIQVGPLMFRRSAASGTWSFRPVLDAMETALEEASPYHAFSSSSDSHATIDRTPSTLMVKVNGRFDLTDEFMRFVNHRSPNRHEHARFLRATFPLRMTMAARAKMKLIKQATERLTQELDSLWWSRAYANSEKKRMLCLMWKDIAVDDNSSTRAANTMMHWIRRRLPATHPDAFSPEEIAACDAQAMDGRPFSPYATPLKTEH